MVDATTLIHGTATASFFLYAAALLLRMRRPSRVASILWTVAFVTMVIHVGCAFQFAHHWSHRAAYEETARQTAAVFGIRSGAGIFANYALLLVWAVEVLRWWRGGISAFAEAFLAFMWFNGTVVFGHGIIRWLGVVLFAALAGMWVAWRKQTRPFGRR